MGEKSLIVWYKTARVLLWALQGVQTVGVWFQTHMHAVFIVLASYVPAAHWWLSGNVKLGLIWGSFVHCDVFVLVRCAFCMLGNVHLLFLEVLDTHLVKFHRGGYFFLATA